MTGRENTPLGSLSRLPFLPSLRLYPAEPQQKGMRSVALLVEVIGAASRGVARVLDQRLGDEALTLGVDLPKHIGMERVGFRDRPIAARLFLLDQFNRPVCVDGDAVGVDGLKLDALPADDWLFEEKLKSSAVAHCSAP